MCVTNSSLLIASTCASLIRSGPGAPFLALRSTLVASGAVTTSNRTSFNGYALGGVLESSNEGDSNRDFQNGTSLSMGRLLESSPQVPRMTSFAVSDWRSRQFRVSCSLCLLFTDLPAYFFLGLSCFLSIPALNLFRSHSTGPRGAVFDTELEFREPCSILSWDYSLVMLALRSRQESFGFRISNATQTIAHRDG